MNGVDGETGSLMTRLLYSKQERIMTEWIHFFCSGTRGIQYMFYTSLPIGHSLMAINRHQYLVNLATSIDEGSLGYEIQTTLRQSLQVVLPVVLLPKSSESVSTFG